MFRTLQNWSLKFLESPKQLLTDPLYFVWKFCIMFPSPQEEYEWLMKSLKDKNLSKALNLLLMEDLRALIVKSCTVFGLQSLLVDDVHIVAVLPLFNTHTSAHWTCVHRVCANMCLLTYEAFYGQMLCISSLLYIVRPVN